MQQEKQLKQFKRNRSPENDLHTQQPGAELTPLKRSRKSRLSQRRRLTIRSNSHKRGERTINHHGKMLKHGMMHDKLNVASR